MSDSGSTDGISPQEAFRMSQAVSAIDNEQWEKFSVEKLGVNRKEVQSIQKKYHSDERYEVIMKWKDVVEGKHFCSQLENLVEEFNRQVVKRSKNVKQRQEYSTKLGKGCALIIVNSFSWSNGYRREKAAEKDVELMEKLWKNVFRCVLHKKMIHKNKSAKEMQDLLKEMSELKKEYDYIVVVISTHGGLYPESVVSETEVASSRNTEHGQQSGDTKLSDEAKEKFFKKFSKSLESAKTKNEIPTVEVFFGDDCVPVREQKFRKYFHNTDADPTLHGIPKFFILDYCRGSSGNFGSTKKALPDEVKKQLESQAYAMLPIASDVIVAYATHPECFAYDSIGGSWLISSVAEVFSKNHRQNHVIDMLTEVNELVKARISAEHRKAFGSVIGWKAMSVFESSLAKDFYLKSNEEAQIGI